MNALNRFCNGHVERGILYLIQSLLRYTIPEGTKTKIGPMVFDIYFQSVPHLKDIIIGPIYVYICIAKSQMERIHWPRFTR